ncbi:RNA-directed DNA polymerase, eukaryota [Tanacetum coccineum]
MNELLAWCKRKRKQALIFKVDFAKAYDSVRWDYLLDVLHAFGFGPNWCKWIQGTFTSAMASILVNGSPTTEFPFFRGLKQGDPLAPFLFILVMESLHLSVSRAVSEEWSDANLVSLVRILNCFYLASGLKINLQKSQVLGVGISTNVTNHGASLIGCGVMRTPFRYLGVSVGAQMSRNFAWANTIQNLHSWLSRSKVKTLLVGGRLTLLKSVLGASPLYNLSIYKAPTGVLHDMESISSIFFNGADSSERKITWVAWEKVLAYKKNGGLGVSSFHALNRALLLKWVWLFLSQDGSIWSRVISAIYGPSLEHHQKRVGDGQNTRFWSDTWISDLPLCVRFPRLFVLEEDKEIKINIFMWRARLDRIPTRCNLASRGVVLESSLCPLCGLAPEDASHVLFRCELSKHVFRRMCRLWDLDWQDVSSFPDWDGITLFLTRPLRDAPFFLMILLRGVSLGVVVDVILCFLGIVG